MASESPFSSAAFSFNFTPPVPGQFAPPTPAQRKPGYCQEPIDPQYQLIVSLVLTANPTPAAPSPASMLVEMVLSDEVCATCNHLVFIST